MHPCLSPHGSTHIALEHAQALQQMNLPQISARKRARGEYMFTEDGLFRDATVRTVPSMTSTLPSAPVRGDPAGILRDFEVCSKY